MVVRACCVHCVLVSVLLRCIMVGYAAAATGTVCSGTLHVFIYLFVCRLKRVLVGHWPTSAECWQVWVARALLGQSYWWRLRLIALAVRTSLTSTSTCLLSVVYPVVIARDSESGLVHRCSPSVSLFVSLSVCLSPKCKKCDFLKN